MHSKQYIDRPIQYKGCLVWYILKLKLLLYKYKNIAREMNLHYFNLDIEK